MEDTTLIPAAPGSELPVVGADQALIAAFAARCRVFAENYHILEMTKDHEDGYFTRLDAYEAIINDTPATTISGVIAKLRIGFLRQSDADWADHAIMGPNCPAFVEGLAAADPTVRHAWTAIEDLAAIGGIDLAAQSAGALPEVSPFETKRLEYLALDQALNTSVTDADADPRFRTMQGEMRRIEEAVIQQPSQFRADAEAKLRFLIDLDRIGVPLDGGEAHVVVKDAARFLLTGEMGA